MRGRQWQQQQRKQQKQQAQWRRMQAGGYHQQQQMKHQTQRQMPQRGQLRRPFEDSPEWGRDTTNYKDWDEDGGVLGFFKTVIKFGIVGLIILFVLRAIL